MTDVAILGELAYWQQTGIRVGAGLAAPMAAPPFAIHQLKNSGTKPAKLLFFEMKK